MDGCFFRVVDGLGLHDIFLQLIFHLLPEAHRSAVILGTWVKEFKEFEQERAKREKRTEKERERERTECERKRKRKRRERERREGEGEGRVRGDC